MDKIIKFIQEGNLSCAVVKVSYLKLSTNIKEMRWFEKENIQFNSFFLSFFPFVFLSFVWFSLFNMSFHVVFFLLFFLLFFLFFVGFFYSILSFTWLFVFLSFVGFSLFKPSFLVIFFLTFFLSFFQFLTVFFLFFAYSFFFKLLNARATIIDFKKCLSLQSLGFA